MNEERTTLLRCERLWKTFDGVEALVDVSLCFRSPGVFAIIGPNGAGKTTLLNVLTRFVQPAHGRCFLGQRDITGLAPEKIAHLGAVRTFQELRLVRQISAVENVMLAQPGQCAERLLRATLDWRVGQAEMDTRNDAAQLLEFVGLKGMEDRLAGMLSYGEQKLLTLACALATGSKIVMLDEPVAGVHPKLITQIGSLMRGIADQGRVVVFIEHDVFAVREFADSVIVMDDGRVIAEGPPSEVLERKEIVEAYVT